MLRLLIADDEIKICQLIEYIIDWNALGVEIVGIVNDGGEAYERIIEFRPDIVITDIRMPIYDGLKLIEKVKKQGLDVHFILISGYREFEYAKRAISFGVENYLLKPIKKTELEDTIYTILQRKQFKDKINLENKEIAREKEFIAKKNREILLQKLLFEHHNDLRTKDLEIINNEYLCHFIPGQYLTIIAKPFTGNDELSQEILLNKMKDIVDAKQLGVTHEWLTMIYGGEVILVLNNAEFERDEISKRARLVHIELSKLRDIFEHLRVIIGISSVRDSLAESKELYNEAKEAMRNRFVSRDNILYFRVTEASKTRYKLLDTKRMEAIMRSCERWDVESVRTELKAIEQQLSKPKYNGGESYQYLMETYSCLELGMRSYPEGVAFPDRRKFEVAVESAYNLKEVFHWLDEHIIKQLEKYRNDKEEQASKPIRIAQAYITEHYNDKLSLTLLSEQLGFNPSYFSVLFKKETGKNFMDYVIEVRMEYAKRFLAETDYDIYEIADRVGYTDVKYFIKLFKKYVELSPMEYRKLYG
ncbi:two-component system response regulator YesN [Lachnospiraceae bacterium PF1-22]|uniref:response regulator n=1 Tax=Ohessyouella blattaphilus TaxID=2949333 RepID=UPI003E2FC035